MAGWREIHAVADRLEPTLRRQFLRAIEQLRTSADIAALARAIGAGNLARVESLLRLGAMVQGLDPAIRTIRRAFERAGQLEARTVSLGQLPEAAIRFDVVNPLAVRHIDQEGARLVRQVTHQTRLAIRQIIRRSVIEHITPRDTATLLKDIVGLTRLQARSITKKRLAWDAAGLSRTTIADRVRAETLRMRKARAVTIARTELINAANQGQIALWQQMRRDGLVRRVSKVWITTPDDRRCPWCRALDGQVVPLDKPFISREFGRRQGPTLHPRCRCAVGLKEVA